MAAEHSYVMRVMALLVQQRASAPSSRRGLTSGQILDRLQSFKQISRPTPENLESVLKALAEINVLIRERDDYGSDRWRWALDIPSTSDGGGFDAAVNQIFGPDGNEAEVSGVRTPPDQPPGDAGGGGNEDGGGAGFGEVLAHDILFCIDDDEFEQLLQENLGNGPDTSAQVER